jgi:hypothetical protein
MNKVKKSRLFPAFLYFEYKLRVCENLSPSNNEGGASKQSRDLRERGLIQSRELLQTYCVLTSVPDP